MGLLSLILVLVLVGVVMWLINKFIPMESNIKMILNIAVVIFLVIWLLQAFGLFSGLNDIHIGK